MKQSQDLFTSFDAVSDQQWHTAIERFLKGKSLDHLHWELEEGVQISPLQRHSGSSVPSLDWNSTQGGNQWCLVETIVVDNSTALTTINQQILHALTNGANALSIQWHYVPSPTVLDQLFEGVLLELIAINFDATRLDPAAIIDSIIHWEAGQQTKGSCVLPSLSIEELWPFLSGAFAKCPSWRWLNFTIAGDNSQGLAHALYQCSLCFDFLLEKGYSTTQITDWVRFNYAVEARYFVSLARIRAFKRCWAALLKAYNADTTPWPWLHANTVNDASADQYRNMLVGTTQAMAAVIGGVDSLWVCPSNGLKESNSFTQRIARNVQHLLQSESYLSRVVDPAQGAYYIEHLTTELTKQAWQQFCEL
ncbi:MAG: methylmalonyl-CoA mutase family protein [Aureispira sp.]